MVKARRLRPYHQGHDLHSRPYHMGAIPPETDGKERLYYKLSGIKRPVLNGPHNCLFARFCSPHEPVVVFCVRPGCVSNIVLFAPVCYSPGFVRTVSARQTKNNRSITQGSWPDQRELSRRTPTQSILRQSLCRTTCRERHKAVLVTAPARVQLQMGYFQVPSRLQVIQHILMAVLQRDVANPKLHNNGRTCRNKKRQQ